MNQLELSNCNHIFHYVDYSQCGCVFFFVCFYLFIFIKYVCAIIVKQLVALPVTFAQCIQLINVCLRDRSNLAVEESLGLLCISQKSLEVKGLRQKTVAVLPHLTQLMPASIQCLEPLG